MKFKNSFLLNSQVNVCYIYFKTKEELGNEIEDLNLILDNIKSHCPKKNKLLILGNAELYFEKSL